MKNIKKLTPALLIVIFLLLCATAFLGYKYISAQKALQAMEGNSAGSASAAEIKALVAKVGKLIELPNETPTVATITDSSKLESQAFFANSKNGDKVLIYAAAKKAILYRESENKIIDVAPVNIGSSSAVQNQARIAIANGTDVAGAASKLAVKISNDFPQMSIVSKTDARGNYDTSVVVILNSTSNTVATNLAKSIGATVGTLPSSETKPANADILVIIGTDLASK